LEENQIRMRSKHFEQDLEFAQVHQETSFILVHYYVFNLVAKCLGKYVCTIFPGATKILMKRKNAQIPAENGLEKKMVVSFFKLQDQFFPILAETGNQAIAQ